MKTPSIATYLEWLGYLACVAALWYELIRHYGFYGWLHPDEYRGRHAGTGHGGHRRTFGINAQRHDSAHASFSVEEVLGFSATRTWPPVPAGKTLLPIQPGSGYHEAWLEGRTV